MESKLYSIVINKLTPIKNNRWVFMSFSGHYSDSPKYVSIKLHELHPEIEIVWLVEKIYFENLPNYVTKVEIGSKEAAKYMASAEVIFDNIYGERAFTLFGSHLFNRLKKKLLQIGYHKTGQRIFSTWHGTPLKRMGRDQIGNDVTDLLCEDVKMVFGNEFTKEVMRHMTFDKIPMNVIGTPRNDLLFHSAAEYFRKRLEIPVDKKIILYAPTFRNDGKDCEGKNIDRSGLVQLKMIDYERLFHTLNQKFGGDWVIICRFHYHVSALVDWEMLQNKYQNRIINGNQSDDMAEYLACSDILLTDASSCMFDFMITKKPCFLFFPDLKHYASEERGFYMPIESLPFPSSTTFEELLNDIECFNESEYVTSVMKLEEKMGYHESGNAAAEIVEWIMNDK